MVFRISSKANSKNAAEILIYEDIGEGLFFSGVTAKSFAEELKKVGKVDALDVRINSYGGNVFDGFAIYNQLMTHGAKITTYVDGIAASIASVIAMAGREIHIAEAGFIMVHDASGGAFGTAKQLREFADTVENITNAIADVYVARSGKTANAVREWMAAETWFGSADAVKNGFATNIIQNMKVAAKLEAPSPRYGYKHAPAAVLTPVSAAPRPQFDAARDRIAAQAATLKAKQRKIA